MSEPLQVSGPRQRLGRRLGLEPYYLIAEQTPTLLRLASRPEANRGAGLLILAGAVAMLVVAVVVAVSGLLSAAGGSGFAVAALAAVVAAAFGGLGYQRAVGGFAVLTTRNSVVCDRLSATLTITQGSKVGAERVQSLAFARIGELRLRRRPLATGWPLRRLRPIVALELLVDEHIWVIDSAADPEALRPAAEGLSQTLGMPLATV